MPAPANTQSAVHAERGPAHFSHLMFVKNGDESTEKMGVGWKQKECRLVGWEF